jgi:hypothetical protein
VIRRQGPRQEPFIDDTSDEIAKWGSTAVGNNVLYNSMPASPAASASVKSDDSAAGHEVPG